MRKVSRSHPDNRRKETPRLRSLGVFALRVERFSEPRAGGDAREKTITDGVGGESRKSGNFYRFECPKSGIFAANAAGKRRGKVFLKFFDFFMKNV